MDKEPVGMLRWESLQDMPPGPHDSDKSAIVGHTSQKTGTVLDQGNLQSIDTFSQGGGWLRAMDVKTGEVW